MFQKESMSKTKEEMFMNFKEHRHKIMDLSGRTLISKRIISKNLVEEIHRHPHTREKITLHMWMQDDGSGSVESEFEIIKVEKEKNSMKDFFRIFLTIVCLVVWFLGSIAIVGLTTKIFPPGNNLYAYGFSWSLSFVWITWILEYYEKNIKL